MIRIFILCIFISATSIGFSQVSINTNNPKALLHIDGASSVATTNPSTGTITPAQAADDVVVTSEGKIGIGILDPETKVDIIGPSTGSIRIVDGSEGDNKLLVADGTSATSTWKRVGVPWFAFLANGSLPITSTYSKRLVNNYSVANISSAVKGNINITAGTITVPVSGRYKITVAGWFRNTWGGTSTALFTAQPELRINNVNVWSPTSFGSLEGYGVWPTFLIMKELSDGDVISLYINETSQSRSNRLDNAFLLIELN